MIILSIDPGVERLGVAVLTKHDGKIAYQMSDTLVTSKKLTQQERINMLFVGLKKLCEQYSPNQIVFEKIFFAKNVNTAIAVAQVQGIIYLLGTQFNCNVSESFPNEIKSAVTGYGNADKKAIKKMIDLQIELPKKKRLDDEYDAIACGYAFLVQQRT